MRAFSRATLPSQSLLREIFRMEERVGQESGAHRQDGCAALGEIHRTWGGIVLIVVQENPLIRGGSVVVRFHRVGRVVIAQFVDLAAKRRTARRCG